VPVTRYGERTRYFKVGSSRPPERPGLSLPETGVSVLLSRRVQIVSYHPGTFGKLLLQCRVRLVQ